MIGPILILVLLVRAALGHGQPVPCEVQTCTLAAYVATAKTSPFAVPVDLGPRPALVVTVDQAADQAAPK